MTLDIDKLRALHEKATPGPWTHVWTSPCDSHVAAPSLIPDDPLYLMTVAAPFYTGRDDGDLICELRNALPALLSEITRLRAVETNPITWQELCEAISIEFPTAHFMSLDAAVPLKDLIQRLATRLNEAHGLRAALDAKEGG